MAVRLWCRAGRNITRALILTDIRGIELMAELSDLFAEQRSHVVEWGGGVIHAVYEFRTIPEQFVVEFLIARDSPVQGLTLKIRGGTLSINGVEASEQVLWRDSAPDVVDVKVRITGKTTPSLKVWNVWRGGYGARQAWLRNAAMRVEESSGGMIVQLQCSDGQGPPNFDDLVARLTLPG